MIRCRLVYSGRVQGVGFRATTAELARGFAVGGTVRNRDDGRVELVVQGDPGAVEAFLDALATALGGKIRDVTRENLEPIEPTGDFRVVV